MPFYRRYFFHYVRTVGHESHDPYSNEKCMEAGVVTFVAHFTLMHGSRFFIAFFFSLSLFFVCLFLFVYLWFLFICFYCLGFFGCSFSLLLVFLMLVYCWWFVVVAVVFRLFSVFVVFVGFPLFFKKNVLFCCFRLYVVFLFSPDTLIFSWPTLNTKKLLKTRQIEIPKFYTKILQPSIVAKKIRSIFSGLSI